MPSWITDLGGLWAAVAAGVLLIVGAVLARRYAKKHPAPPTWPEMWKRMDEQDGRIDALEKQLADERQAREEEKQQERLEREKERRVVGSILTKLLEQFSNGSLPQFDATELAYLETTIPRALFRRLKRA